MEPASGSTSVLVFTRDLRVRDHPALTAAASRGDVVPLFVFDPAALGSLHGAPNRVAYLLDALADLRAQLTELGGDLVLRHGDWVETVSSIVDTCGASSVHLSHDVSGFARRRIEALEASLGASVTLHRHPGITVLPPGATSPSSGGDWKVFTPYYRRWLEAPLRPLERVPEQLSLPDAVSSGGPIDPGPMPAREDLVTGDVSPDLISGGETVALERLRAWAADSLVDYEDRHNDLPGDASSRISADLHFGCLSPLEVAARLRERPGGGPFVRQLCWRDFYHQALAGRPETAHQDYRSRNDHWRSAPDELEAWRTGHTGFPIVDAGMRQLLAEGFMHNRTRMIVASFLTKDMYVDWREGAAHFMAWLVDGDVANNQLNWQWTAGTGTDSNPNRIFNPTVQSKRFDPDGEYIRRYVPELRDVTAPDIHEPDDDTRDRVGYPHAIVDHHAAIEFYREQLAAQRG